MSEASSEQRVGWYRQMVNICTFEEKVQELFMANDLLMPHSPPLEDEILPTPERIAEAAKASVAD